MCIRDRCLLLLYVFYLSLLYGGQDFMTFQWDAFLLLSLIHI